MGIYYTAAYKEHKGKTMQFPKKSKESRALKTSASNVVHPLFFPFLRRYRGINFTNQSNLQPPPPPASTHELSKLRPTCDSAQPKPFPATFDVCKTNKYIQVHFIHRPTDEHAGLTIYYYAQQAVCTTPQIVVYHQ